MSYQVTSRCPPQGTLPSIYEVFVGRQPIYTQQLDVFAYELLFRRGEMQHAGVTDGNQATAHVLVNTFLELGLDTLVGSKRAFVNLTRDFLLQDYSWSSQQTGWCWRCWKMSLSTTTCSQPSATSQRKAIPLLWTIFSTRSTCVRS